DHISARRRGTELRLRKFGARSRKKIDDAGSVVLSCDRRGRCFGAGVRHLNLRGRSEVAQSRRARAGFAAFVSDRILAAMLTAAMRLRDWVARAEGQRRAAGRGRARKSLMRSGCGPEGDRRDYFKGLISL
ncbi:MAG TPA: hypothetical protein VGH49_03760, partial [Xanthobacteraceae bacterium]